MKASIKFRDDQKPLFKAKLPFSILGFPLQSGFIAGEKKDLCLTFKTIFSKGLSFKLKYRPNDSCNHLTFGIKAAIGQFSSLSTADPITVSAELNLLGFNQSPAFFLRLRPQLGDFSIRRSLQSLFSYPYKLQLQESKEEDEQSNATSSNIVHTMFSGLEVNARTAVPVRDLAVVRFRWNVKVQECDPMAVMVTCGNMAIMPCLVLNKVEITSVAGSGNKRDPEKSDSVAEACLAVNKEMGLLQEESNLLTRGIDEIRL